MRVLTLTNFYPPHAYGGYELACADVMRRWRERGHEVTVLTSTHRVPRAATHDDPAVRRALTMYWRDHVVVAPPVSARARIERANQRALARALAAARPDVVSVWNMGGMSLSLLTAIERAGHPLVLYVCDDWLIYAPAMDAWTRLFRQRPIVGRAVGALARLPTALPALSPPRTRAAFVSRFSRDNATRDGGWRFPDAPIVPTGIEVAEFAGPPRDPAGWHDRLLYVGRIDQRKGIATAIRALPKLPNMTLDVVGAGDDVHLAELRGLIDELDLTARVRFSTTTRDALGAVYRGADVVIFPSEWGEPFGLVPLEAMTCGLPVVATGVGGSAEFLTDRDNCLLYPAGDPGALAAAVDELKRDPRLRRRLVDRGHVTARTPAFTMDGCAAALEQLHLDAVGASP